jgi:hypothetical protein
MLIEGSHPSVTFKNGTKLRIGPNDAVSTQWTPEPGGLRSTMLPAERDISVGFDRALAEVGMREQETIHVELQPGTPGERVASETDVVVLKPAAPPKSGPAVQVVFYQDESGGVSWHFPDGFLSRGSCGRAMKASGDVGATFTIRARTAAARAALAESEPSERLRGPITKLFRKIFKVLLVPLEKLAEPLVEAIVGKVERKYRQELVRGVTADDYRLPVKEAFTRFSDIDDKRALLIVHGILSTTHGMLTGLPREAMEALIKRYEGRVIAFDQLSLVHSPEDNARFFLETLRAARPAARFPLDILCHSRGGIVARTLVERGRELVPEHTCSFGSVYFVAAPNAGSPLGDADHIVDMIDVFTNLLTALPDGPATYSLEVILAIVKLAAYSLETELPGLAGMSTEPKGYIAKVLNKNPAFDETIRYAAATANYEPVSGKSSLINGTFADGLMDRVFGTANDLVVPTEGVFAANGYRAFPIQKRLVYGPQDGVWHTDFFGHPRTLRAIFEHLEVPTPAFLSGFGEEPAVEEELAETTAELELEPEATLLSDDGGFRDVSLYGNDAAGGLGGSGGFGGPSREPVAQPRRPEPPRRPRAERASAVKRTDASLPTERVPKIDFHERVIEGEKNALLVRLEDAKAAGSGPMRIDFLPGEESVPITVRLHAPGFDVEPDSGVQDMVIKRVRDPRTERVEFQLVARSPGSPMRREIIAEFWQRNTIVGSVTHATVVVPKVFAGGSVADAKLPTATFAMPAVRRQDCDLILMVEGLPGQTSFRFKLRSEIPEDPYAVLDCGSIDLPLKELQDYISTTLAKVLGAYPNPTRAEWTKSFLFTLNDLGKRLWGWLPLRFREKYFELYEKGLSPASIHIHSDELVYPWELVVPNEVRGGKFVELPPLGVAHVLGRWKSGLRTKPVPQSMRVSSFVVLNPQYPPPNALPWAKEEAEDLQGLFKTEPFHPANEAHVRDDLLSRNDVQILHFSGHGAFDSTNADLSEILLEDRTRLTASALATTKLGGEASPIAYFNACSVGAVGITVGRSGGFAGACLDGGFSGVIAPYWPINDKVAAEFAVALYKKLALGRAIGEALRELREERPNDPTARAFAFYGDPWTRINLDALRRAPKAPAPANAAPTPRTKKPARGTRRRTPGR